MNTPKFSISLFDAGSENFSHEGSELLPAALDNYVSKPGLNQFRIDISAQNLPSNFLGTAFDLIIDGTSWEYERYQIAPQFQRTLTLTSQRNFPSKRLIFGLSLKRGSTFTQELRTSARPRAEREEPGSPGAELTSWSEASSDQLQSTQPLKIVSFYIKIPEVSELKINFAHAVLSIFDGQRKDIIADFQPAKFELNQILNGLEQKGEVAAQSSLQEQETAAIISEDESISSQESAILTEDLPEFEANAEVLSQNQQQLSANIFNAQISLYQLYSVLLIVLVFLLLAGLAVLLYRKLKRKT